MAKYTFITFGKIKSDPIAELVDYYYDKLSKYVKTEMRVLKDVQDRPIEIRDLNSTLKQLGYTVALSEKGNDFTTEGFKFFVTKRFNYESEVTFIVGNAFGLHTEFSQYSNYVLSLSKMTYPHELSLVLLLEQLYRVSNMTEGGKYHK